MSRFYKMDPADWDFGTADLSLEQEAAYLRVVNAIHKHDGPVPNIDRVLAGLFRCSTRKARSLITALVDAGKVYVEDDHIWNDRARSDLTQRQFVSVSRAESGAKGGRTRAERSAKALTDSDPPQASASSRIEENREEKGETNVSPKKKGSRLSAEWRLPKAWGEWAMNEGLPELDTRREADKFRDYWIGVAGAKGVKLDWQATWRNWVRKALSDRKQSPKVGQSKVGETRRFPNGQLKRWNGGLEGWITIHEDDDADSMGNPAGSGDRDEDDGGDDANDVSRMQSAPEEQTGSLPERDVQAGRGGVELLALRMVGGAVL